MTQEKICSQDKTMEKIKSMFDQYYDQAMAWYNSLEQLYQYGVLFLLILAGLLIVVFFIISRVTK